jgi:hypothetical protein
MPDAFLTIPAALRLAHIAGIALIRHFPYDFPLTTTASDFHKHIMLRRFDKDFLGVPSPWKL